MPRLVIVGQSSFAREGHGVEVQHVTTLRELLERAGWSVETTDLLDPDLSRTVLPADLVLVSMLPAPEVETIVHARRRHGLPTVFEITDNFLELDSWDNRSPGFRRPVLRQRLLFHAWLCDALQVYAEGLAELFGPIARRTLRFDPYVPIPDRVPERPPGFVVGWGGTRSHAPDVAAIAPVVVAFCARHPDVRFAFMGDRELYESNFAAIGETQRSYRPFGDHDEYLEFVGGLHVGLAPQRPTGFNAARTDTRVATYAALGVAAVLEDGPAHRSHGDHARLFRTPDELDAILEELLADPKEVARLAARARAWVCSTRSADALSRQRDDAYRGLLAERPGDDPAPPAPRPDRAELASALREAGALDPADALPAIDDLLERHPGYEQAELVRARTLERLGRDADALAAVDAAAPSEIYADLLAEIAVRCARRVAEDRVDELLGGISSPYLRVRLSAKGTPLERSRAILEHQPFDHLSLVAAVAELTRTSPDSPELDELYARTALVDPDRVPAHRRPRHLAPFLAT